MRLSNPIILPATFGLLLLAGAAAHAEPIWSYTWSSSPGVVTSNDGTLGKVTLLPGSGGPITGNAFGQNFLLASSLEASAGTTSTATFTNRTYGLAIHLTDLASKTSHDLSFAGALSGTLGKVNSLTNAFTGPTTQSYKFADGNLYTVSIGLFKPPAPGTPGQIGANVLVTGSGTVTPPVNNVPEPTSLVLAGLGISAVGVRYWRRKTRPAQRDVAG